MYGQRLMHLLAESNASFKYPKLYNDSALKL